MMDAAGNRARVERAQQALEQQLAANLQSPRIEWTAETRERLIAEVERRMASRRPR